MTFVHITFIKISKYINLQNGGLVATLTCLIVCGSNKQGSKNFPKCSLVGWGHNKGIHGEISDPNPKMGGWE